MNLPHKCISAFYIYNSQHSVNNILYKIYEYQNKIDMLNSQINIQKYRQFIALQDITNYYEYYRCAYLKRIDSLQKELVNTYSNCQTERKLNGRLINFIESDMSFDECSVCLDTTKIPSLSCNHPICVKCFTQWFRISDNPRCPICRQNI